MAETAESTLEGVVLRTKAVSVGFPILRENNLFIEGGILSYTSVGFVQVRKLETEFNTCATSSY